MYEGDCIHFTGIGIKGDARGGHSRTCKAGVNYRAHVGGEELGWARRIPCLPQSAKEPVPCPHFRAMTRAEHDAREAEVRAAIDRALGAIAAGKCHVCGADAEPTQMVGRCRYAACGHRIGQVDDGESDVG